MTFRGLVIKFHLDGAALKPLVALGYSKPTSKDDIRLTRLTDYGSIEVRKVNDSCMVLCLPAEGLECAGQLFTTALGDLEKAGIYTDTPF